VIKLWVVQRATAAGWLEVSAVGNRTQAERIAADLRTDASAWLAGERRLVRIVTRLDACQQLAANGNVFA
jgi:hypothetical protein